MEQYRLQQEIEDYRAALAPFTVQMFGYRLGGGKGAPPRLEDFLVTSGRSASRAAPAPQRKGVDGPVLLRAFINATRACGGVVDLPDSVLEQLYPKPGATPDQKVN